ncbi:oligogalacturonate-specific porin KdgM family protein [Pantoea sp. Ep11b]|uniref:oligogalacturonate-specific porin KdgM family protein n=1 Tax=Pantoea sp. Ep11b TaxID=3141459 RepID=UPI00346145DC
MKAMMKKQALASAVMISAMPLSAFALDFSSTGVDIREAYTTGSKMFQTRLQISTVINDSVSFSYQNTINNGSNYTEFKNNYSEVEVTYAIPLTDRFSFIPDMVFSWGHKGSHIDPYLKFNYQLSPQFGVMAGYRYYHYNYKTPCLDDSLQRNSSHEYDLWLNWQVTDKLFVNYNPVYLQKQNDFHFGNNKKEMWQHTLYLSYQYDSHWKPFGDISDLGRAGNGDKEYRMRIGLKYLF